MRILVFWDVFGRIWRAALKKELPRLKEKHKPDFVVVNIENATSWRWAIEKHAREIWDLWVDVMTTWDHVFDNLSKIEDYLDEEDSKVIRWANFYENKNYRIPWKWYKILENNWKRLLFLHLIGEVFMNKKVLNPFEVADDILEKLKWEKFDWIMIDFHKEATAEWYWLAYYLDGRVSAIFGTHTHIQTNDELILPKWTWILSDVWMNWPLYSVIWADFKSVEKRFLTGLNKWKIEQCLDKNYVVNWAIFDIGDDMKCEKIEKIRIRGKLI
jgi:metallophosphoesterase (TIGR00282 family)